MANRQAAVKNKTRTRNVASPSFLTRPITLDEAERQKLLAILGCPVNGESSARTVDRIERVLGAYAGFKVNVDGAPRAGDYQREYDGVAREAVALLNRLLSMNGYLSTQLEARFSKMDGPVADSAFDDFVTALVKLQGVAAKLAGDYKGQDSGGVPKHEALTFTICGLRQIFQETYQGEVAARKKSGDFEYLAPQEDAELDFAHHALKFAKISFTDKELPRLFRDPRCIPMALRSEKVEAIARKVARGRKSPPRQKPPAKK